VVKLLIYLVLVGSLVVFTSQNLVLVDVYLIAGRPMQLPLIVIIGLSFFCGFLFAILTVIRRVLIGRKKRAADSELKIPRDE
jgi:uncharacterized integral membrane protein